LVVGGALLCAVLAGGTTAFVALRSDSSAGDGASATSTTAIGDAALSTAQLAEQRSAEAWSAEAQHALQPLLDETPALESAINRFLAGTASTDVLASETGRSLNAFVGAAQAVRALPPFPGGTSVNDEYVRSARLYIEWAHLAPVLVTSAPGDLRTQLGLMARRVRELGDRVFDRGQDVVTPRLHLASSPDVQLRLPLEVPDWPAEGLEPGPPLAPSTPPPTGPMPVREGARPTQSRAAWIAAVRHADLPAPGVLGRAIDRGDAVSLRNLASRLEATAAELDGVPDPVGGREDADLARLALLVHAEAARAGQAATLLSAPDDHTLLIDAARSLAAIGDELWPHDLPSQQS
jgi:hypothetical protein